MKAPPVEATQARRGTLPLVERLSGTVRAENQVVLFPEISGRIIAVLVTDGQSVEANQPLVQLQNDAASEQLRQAEAGFRVAEARLRQARAQLAEVEAQTRRTRTLGDRNLVSDVELETLLARRESAAADVDLTSAQSEQAASTVAEARDALTKTVMRAPIAGVVGSRDAEVGMQVSTSTRLFIIGNLDRVSVRIVLTDSMLRYLAPGQAVRIFANESDKKEPPLMASLTRISPFLNNITRSTVAEIELPNPNRRLQPGMFVPVDVLYGETQLATLLPTSALYTDPNTGSEGVFVAVESPVFETPGDFSNPVPIEFRPVSSVTRGATKVAVENVESDEWIVTLGQQLLTTGRSEARVHSVSWDHVMELQGLQREDLLAEVLEPRAPLPAVD
jgi:HlyD family secretion protein